MKAEWNGEILAQSNETKIVEGNHYFPPESINKQFFNKSDTKTTCSWKGQASYYTLVVNGQLNMDAAWTYSEPKKEVEEIKNYVAFWKGVNITE